MDQRTKLGTSGALLAAVLAGCALTPTEMREQWPVKRHESALPPAQAAACMGRAAEQWRGDQIARWREGARAGEYELMIGPGGGTSVVVDITPRGTGSLAVAYAHESFVRRSLMAAMFRGC